MPAASPAFTLGTPPREPWPIGPVTPPVANAAASVVIHQLGTTGTASVDQVRSLLQADV